MKFRNWLKKFWQRAISGYVEIAPLSEYEVARLFRDKQHPLHSWIELDSRERTLKTGLFDQDVTKRIRFPVEVEVERTVYRLPLEIVLQHSFTGSGGAFVLGETCIFMQTAAPRFATPVLLPEHLTEYILKQAQLCCFEQKILVERIPSCRWGT